MLSVVAPESFEMHLRAIAAAAGLVFLSACNATAISSPSTGLPTAPASESEVSSVPVFKGMGLRYPPRMLDVGIEGSADISCNVSVQGTTSGCKVISIVGSTVFGDAALDYVKAARYRPALRNGLPVATQHSWSIKFKIAPTLAPEISVVQSADWMRCLGPIRSQTGPDVTDACNRVLAAADTPTPVKASAYQMLGLNDQAMKRDDLAVVDFSKAIEQRGDPIDLYRLRGGAYLAQHDFARAAGDFDFLLKISLNDVQALRQHADASIGLGDTATAERDINAALLIRPDDPSLYIRRASLVLAKGNQDAALVDLDAALRLNGTEVSALRARCDLYRKMGKPIVGDADCAAAETLDPEHKINTGPATARS